MACTDENYCGCKHGERSKCDEDEETIVEVKMQNEWNKMESIRKFDGKHTSGVKEEECVF